MTTYHDDDGRVLITDGGEEDDGADAEASGDNPMEILASVKDTVEQTKESVESHGDRLEKHADRLDELQNDIDEVRDLAETAKEAATADPDDEGEGDTEESKADDDDDDDDDDEDKQDLQALAEEVADELDLSVAQVLDAFDEMKGEGEEQAAGKDDDDLDVEDLAEKVAKELDIDEDVDRTARFEVEKEATQAGDVNLTEEDIKEAIPK